MAVIKTLKELTSTMTSKDALNIGFGFIIGISLMAATFVLLFIVIVLDAMYNG